MTLLNRFSGGQLDAICGALTETAYAISGNEIADLLAKMGIQDPTPFIEKRRRLFNALQQKQEGPEAGKVVMAFVERVMDPSAYGASRSTFEHRRDALVKAMAPFGYTLTEHGKVRLTGGAGRTPAEVEAAASRLQSALSARGVYPAVLRHCRPELMTADCFPVVMEAAKAVSDKVRVLAGGGRGRQRAGGQGLRHGDPGQPGHQIQQVRYGRRAQRARRLRAGAARIPHRLPRYRNARADGEVDGRRG